MTPITVVRLSRPKLLLLALAGASFVALGYFLYQIDAAEIAARRKFNSPFLVHGTGLLCMLFFGAALLAVLRKLIDRSPGLVLDAAGLTDNSSAFSGGFIAWSNISGIREWGAGRHRILYILLKDRDKYIQSCGPLKRALLNAARNIAPSPVAINPSFLSIDFDELVALIRSHVGRNE